MRRQTYIQLHRTRTFRFVVAVCISIATYYMGLLTCVILLVLLSFYYFIILSFISDVNIGFRKYVAVVLEKKPN